MQAQTQPQEINSGHAPSIGIVNNHTANACLPRNSSESTAMSLEANNNEQETSAYSNNAEPMLTFYETLANSEIQHDDGIHLTDLDLRFGKTECV